MILFDYSETLAKSLEKKKEWFFQKVLKLIYSLPQVPLIPTYQLFFLKHVLSNKIET